MSTRNNRNLIILPKNLLARNQFQHISSHYWNMFQWSHNIVIEVLKNKLKVHLLEVLVKNYNGMKTIFDYHYK